MVGLKVPKLQKKKRTNIIQCCPNVGMVKPSIWNQDTSFLFEIFHTLSVVALQIGNIIEKNNNYF